MQRQSLFSRRDIGRSTLSAMALSTMSTSTRIAMAQAGPWPNGSIKLIVPLAAGGATDILSRFLTEKLAVALKTPVMVDNRPGAGTTIGATVAAQAKPDGYTLLMMSNAHVSAPAIYRNLPYDPLTSFVPISRLTTQSHVLAVPSSLPVKTLQEFIGLARSQPGMLNYSSSGAGGNQHLMTEMFLADAGIQVKHIPYKGSGQAMTDLIGGMVQMGLMASSNAISVVKSGKLRALAVTTLKREPALPDVPTMDESGLKGFDAKGWLALAALKGTPPAVLTRLEDEVRQIMDTQQARKVLGDAALTVDLLGSVQMASFMRDESDRWIGITRRLNITE